MKKRNQNFRRTWWLVASLAGLLVVCLLIACNGTSVLPGPGGSGTDTTPLKPNPVVTDPQGNTVTNADGTPVTYEPIETPTEPAQTSGSGSGAVTEPPVLVIPGDDEPVSKPSTPAETEEPAYDPALHPGDASLYSGVLIHSVYGTGKKGAEALISNGYIQLYNNSAKDISLKGASLYYKSDGANPFDQFVFPEGAVIPAGGYYLVRTDAPADFNPDNAVLKVEHFDAEWDVYLDNKEIRLLLAPSGWSIGRDEDITAFDDAVSIFVATMDYHHSVYALYDLSRNKIAVRTAMKDYSGYHTVNLTRAATPELRKLCTRTSTGEVNEVVASRLNEVFFSHDAGIYEKALSLSLSAKAGYTIYYTTDGSDPSLSTNRNRKTYNGAIQLQDTSAMGWGPLTRSWTSPSVSTQVGGHVIKAYATNGTDSTDVFTNTYFITDDLSKYGVSIMSISMPKDEVIGPQGFYNNFLLTNSITGGRRRGVGIMEVFDADGNRVGNSRVEMAVSGNGSSGWGMKSLRFYLKSANNQDAGLESDLNYDIFGGAAKDAWGQAITSFSRFMIRNSGNDCATSFIRDAYMQSTAAGLNVDHMATASTLVFINGEFWGVYNFRERYSPEYVESHYGVNKDNVTVIESDYSQVHTNTNAPYVVSSGMEGDADPFNDMVQYMREHNLSHQEYYDHVASLMDVDSFIDMWVVRLFYVARDWPENNIKVWRNKNPDDPSGFDTKWHFTLLDLDMGLSYYDFTTEQENFF
ncbi:MAG: CotH kinase family protein, partial [Clostridia bacterium]|nr:CotH kinase family protein [Clostridia bacterium]